MSIITIITPSFNQGQFIEETINSVLSQTYKDIQYILIDGGSTDNTMEVVNKYKDKIDIIINEKDKGQSDAINKGFKLAKGELVGWINSDDLLYPNCVEKIVELYNMKPDGSIYYPSKLDWINAKSEIINTVEATIPDRNYLLNEDYRIIQQGSFYVTKMLREVNYIDETIFYCMDLDLWLKLLKHGPVYSYNSETISAFRIWEGTKTFTGQQKFLRNIKEVLIRNGASRFSKTILKTDWYTFKTNIKQLLKIN